MTPNLINTHSPIISPTDQPNPSLQEESNAESVNNAIVKYILGNINQNDVTEAINKLSLEILKKTIPCGNTHFVNAIYLSFELIANGS